MRCGKIPKIGDQIDSGSDRIFKPKDFHKMLADIDLLLFAAPLTTEGHHMISDAQFRVMNS